jgi:hypothetical protein
MLAQQVHEDGDAGGRRVVGDRHGPPRREQRQPCGLGRDDHPLGQFDQALQAVERGQVLAPPAAALAEVVCGDVRRRGDLAGGLPAVAHRLGCDEAQHARDRVGPHVAQRTAAPRHVERPPGEPQLAGLAHGARIVAERAAELQNRKLAGGGRLFRCHGS